MFLRWCHINGMEVNTSKCHVVHFGSKNPNHTYFINSLQIHDASFERDLGVYVDFQLSFSQHISFLLPKLYNISHQFFLTLNASNPAFYVDLFNICMCTPYCVMDCPSAIRDFKRIFLESIGFLDIIQKICIGNVVWNLFLEMRVLFI